MRQMILVQDAKGTKLEGNLSTDKNKIIPFEKSMEYSLKEITKKITKDEELKTAIVLYKNFEEMVKSYTESGWKNARKHIKMHSEKGMNTEELTKEFIVFDYKSEVYIYLTKTDVESEKEFFEKIKKMNFR